MRQYVQTVHFAYTWSGKLSDAKETSIYKTMKRRNWTTLLIHSSMLLEGWCEWQDNGPIFWRWPIKLNFYMVALSMVIPTQYDTAICRSHGQKMKQPHLGPLCDMTIESAKVPPQCHSENPTCLLAFHNAWFWAFENAKIPRFSKLLLKKQGIS